VVTIRERIAVDDDAIRCLNDAAFGGPAESSLIADLRAARLATIELLALQGAEPVGHILFSRLAVVADGRPVDTLALAPMAVRPDRQRNGVGSALVEAGLGIARRGIWRAVIVLGHPTYYPRFGFSAERARNLAAPFRGDAFMALELVPGALNGAKTAVVYPPAFAITPRRGPVSAA
jgi:putative acetyltransferase